MEFDDQRMVRTCQNYVGMVFHKFYLQVPMVKVISMILKFTPEELNRVQAKVAARLNPLAALGLPGI